MGQQKLHSEDERREGNGNTSQSISDQETSGAPQTLMKSTIKDSRKQQVDEAVANISASDTLPTLSENSGQDWIRTTFTRQRLNVIKEELFLWFKTIVSACVYATLIVTFGFQVARVEGQSMAPTLADQDRLIVNKLAYRMGEPRHGDIVMLHYPLNPDKSFVKRVIAEEGDSIRIVNGQVYVNNVPMTDDFVPPEFKSHDDFGPTVIREGYYFVLGDHRNNSSDSRHWGEVPKKYVIGRVQLRWWPLSTARMF